jgi:septum formation protein
LILASASPARLGVLRAAGVDPVVCVSGVDEDAVAATLTDPAPEHVVATLAEAKALWVAAEVLTRYPAAVVIGCDSMLHSQTANGPVVEGKPHTDDVARERWKRMAGTTAALLTGHCAVKIEDGRITDTATETATTTIHFGNPTAAEIDSYVATGEPLSVAGAFTLDGRGGWFVDRIDGDPSSVIGISLPLTRKLLARMDISVIDLWR